MTNNEKQQSDNSFIPYEKNSAHGGIEKIIRMEMDHIQGKATTSSEKKLVGLALSGGGIRSAIFSLGVMQRLARVGWMEKIEYLSTVSGGGYIGSSLTWFLQSKKSENSGGFEFGTSMDDFPFGTHRLGKINPESTAEEKGGGADKVAVSQALRQNGKYLTPGNGITIFSLLGVFLRGTFLSIIVYFPLLVLFFLVLYQTWFLRPTSKYTGFLETMTRLDIPALKISYSLNFSLVLALALILFSILGTIFYAFHTYRPVLYKKRRYIGRRHFDITSGKIIVALLVLTALGSLPYIHEWLNTKSSNDNTSVFTAAGSMAFGFISTVIAFMTSSSYKEKLAIGSQSSLKPLLLSLLTFIATFSLFYGVMLLAYSFVFTLMNGDTPGLFLAYSVWVLIALFTGRYVNINYVSVHRFYRDRLMETFMPNIRQVIENGCNNTELTAEADRFKLSTVGHDKKPTPYHIINTNIVLVESYNKKIRARGGDSFILSPLFCGSSATGWSKTDKFMNDEMTLATAMAISGAAANPDTGIGGEGPTRNRPLSLLMSLLNIRLGYWAPHPNPEIHRREETADDQSKLKKLTPLYGFRPNFFHPMLTSTSFGSFIKKIFKPRSAKAGKGSYTGKNEHSHFVELTDGGHFENLGLYELIRRQLKTIIVCDGGSDPNFEFSDLANAIEKVRVDFGVVIDLDIKPLIALEDKNSSKIACAETGYVKGEIHYPDNTTGTLLYIKTTFVKDVYPDLFCYKKLNPRFPDQSTTDQFFDEKQFEAYRGLGNYIAKKLTSEYMLQASGELENLDKSVALDSVGTEE